MLFIVDTNTLVSAILKPESVPMKALAKAEEMGNLLFSSETTHELLSVIQREKFDKYRPLAERPPDFIQSKIS